MSTFEEILSAALALPPGMRAMLADHLFASLDGDIDLHLENFKEFISARRQLS